MTRRESLSYKFVDNIPEAPTPGILYVSVSFATAIHQCCCGCGNEVVTPLSPTGWSLTFDGKSVSLSPSIGNWGFHCQSHYWIRRNQILWSAPRHPRAPAKNRARNIGEKVRRLMAKFLILKS